MELKTALLSGRKFKRPTWAFDRVLSQSYNMVFDDSEGFHLSDDIWSTEDVLAKDYELGAFDELTVKDVAAAYAKAIAMHPTWPGHDVFRRALLRQLGEKDTE